MSRLAGFCAHQKCLRRAFPSPYNRRDRAERIRVYRIALQMKDYLFDYVRQNASLQTLIGVSE